MDPARHSLPTGVVLTKTYGRSFYVPPPMQPTKIISKMHPLSNITISEGNTYPMQGKNFLACQCCSDVQVGGGTKATSGNHATWNCGIAAAPRALPEGEGLSDHCFLFYRMTFL